MSTPRPTPRSPIRRAGGFTLLEILIAVAIVGLLATLLVVNLDKIFGGATASVAKIWVNDTIKTPLMKYRIDVGNYPSTAEGLNALLTSPAGRADHWKGPYLESRGGTELLDPWKNPYQYRYPGQKNPGSYDIWSRGPDGQDGTADDVGNW